MKVLCFRSVMRMGWWGVLWDLGRASRHFLIILSGNIIIILSYSLMNFLNYFLSKAEKLQFNLLPQASHFQKQNTLLVQPAKQGSSFVPVQDQPPAPNLDAPDLGTQAISSQVLPQDMTMLLTQEQLLINQFMQLRYKHLAEQLARAGATVDNQPAQAPSRSRTEENSEKPSHEAKVLGKKIKKTTCGHSDKAHYAKGMCSGCYHKLGRTKKPWNCPHDKMYAAGMCQNCYINDYNRKRREGRDKNPASKDPSEVSLEQSNN